jgi:L-asparaginase
VTSLPRIRLLAFGGTIASVASPDGASVEPTLVAAQIVESVPQIAAVAQLELRDFAPVGSYEVTPVHMLALAREVEQARAGGSDGVVLTHGTDTIEETAYALALMTPRTGPVVLAGAMRNPTMAGPDGPANLLNAVRVASSPAARELGPLVVLNDEVHAARFATKAHTTKPSAIVSAGAGALGEIVEGRVDIWWRPAWDDHLGLPAELDGAAVELVRIATGVSDRTLRACAGSGAAGVVIEGTGGGHVPTPLLPALDALVAAGVPVVVASRLPAGSTMERTYGMSGAELDLIGRGAITAGRISGPKARLRLLVGLALGRDPRSLFPVR